MNEAFYVGAIGMRAQQKGLETIAHNISNINTVAFKRSEIRFSELVSATSGEQAGLRTADVAMSGVQASEAPKAFEQGQLRMTQRQFDLAIQGEGLVEVLGPAGQNWLWRGGSLKVNEEGLLSTEDGHVLKSLIQVPEGVSELEIDAEGGVKAIYSDAGKVENLGNIALVMPENPAALEAVGGGFYHLPDEGEVKVLDSAQNAGHFVQGALESSNVDLSSEMVALLLTQRAYGANAQVVQAGDQLMAIANGLRR